MSLMINVRELATKSQPVEMEEQLDMSDLAKERKEILSIKPLQVKLKAQFIAGNADVTGECVMDVEYACSRCLTSFWEKAQIPVHEVFAKQVNPATSNEEEEIHIVTEDQVDLRPYVEEAVILELPFAPLCSEDCKGLCPVCGQNKNEQPCDCKQDTIDPRLAGLQEFFNK